MPYKIPKFPRALVSLKRHKALAIEAAKRKMTVAEVAEEKFAKAGK